MIQSATARGFLRAANRPNQERGKSEAAGLQQLQVLAFPVDLPEEGLTYHLVPPDTFDEAGRLVSESVKSVLKREVNYQYPEADGESKETRERLHHLLGESFSEEVAREVHRGYVDDLRNTDHAWIEATVYHHHLPRELGNQLPLRHPGCTAEWVAITDPRLNIHSHYAKRQWLDAVKLFAKEEYGTPGLLQLVVRWGRDDMTKLVLRDHDLQDQRQPRHLQRAFQDAVEHAMEPSFDVSLVDTLLEQGAEAANLFLPDLFTKITNDSFGFCAELAKEEANWGRKRRFRSTFGGGGGGTTAGGGGGGGGGGLGGADDAVITSPWRWKHVQLMTTTLQVRGFDDYARRQPVVRYLDLMCWALTVGNLELAQRMWQRTKSPLRAGLLAQTIW